MNNVRAVLLTEYGGSDAVTISSVAAPLAGAGQVLVRVHAAGVNGLDWKVREGYVRDAFPLQLPTVLGIELAGVVEAVGPGVTRLRKGDRVMGAPGALGAYADLVAVSAANLATVPGSMSFVEAAALPVAAVAAWQSLHFAGPIRAGQRILIQGAAGGLGGFAVQYAHQAGAEVFATALGSHADYVRSLGADHVIAYDQQKFEASVSSIDLVLDYVGGDVLTRSWSVLSADGVVVSTASPDILASAPAGRRGLWFVNTPDAARLQEIADDVAHGRLQSKVDAVVRFDELPTAIERNRTQPQVGKTVANFFL
ncbi:NADP-dependent oxidoreductase [Paraburkholderia kirstenboschensis]|uniref:NADP-dependent oxidoreductase n=1 Tax=Paraburkholderia kirstenboschensis TaxID=1245436 RepID=A0ABZ0EFS5_9BURK|nr:NADP-dependent oxidoreductase [Paraburkholderia kirstenboschensis]WOD15404.1 NADP-dependent oxidoreductase [Paraburkholderia kirstenboschensis]